MTKKNNSILNLVDFIKESKTNLHSIQIRDKIKSSEYHYSIGFDFGGEFDSDLVKELFKKIGLISKKIEYTTFLLGVTWPIELTLTQKSHYKQVIQTELLKKIQLELKKTIDFENNPDAEFLVDFRRKLIFLRLRPIYVFGKYNKYSRDVAQTEYFCNKCRGKACWYCNETGHFSSESIEQLIAPFFVKEFGGELIIFHGAGREDLDVLMLGEGRPFVVEVLLPKKRSVSLELIEKNINSSLGDRIKINSLEFCDLERVSKTKDALHDKIYTALIECEEEFDLTNLVLGKELIVSQFTPTRVSKRRGKFVREKRVVLLDCFAVSNREFVLSLRTSHGTYVKEFISSDKGKTVPSISSILKTNCSCALLDVEEVL